MRKVKKKVIANNRHARIIDALHDHCGMTYAEIGEACGCDGATIWRIEREGNTKSPRAVIADKLDDLAHERRLAKYVG